MERQTKAMLELSHRGFPEPETVPDDEPALIGQACIQRRRQAAVTEAAGPSAPAFVGIDRWGHIAGGMGPDSVTRAIKRISRLVGVPIAGLATRCAPDWPPRAVRGRLAHLHTCLSWFVASDW
ncbi:hypothetical protein [Streptomyces sp. NPDC048361]|uniref:hypothetical protein n=1 Tax=Streptomyces sp. NPDC048361 TaxID=3154720 RepID=UPI0034334356